MGSFGQEKHTYTTDEGFIVDMHTVDGGWRYQVAHPNGLLFVVGLTITKRETNAGVIRAIVWLKDQKEEG